MQYEEIAASVEREVGELEARDRIVKEEGTIADEAAEPGSAANPISVEV